MNIQNYKIIELNPDVTETVSIRTSSEFVTLENIGSNSVQCNIEGYQDLIEILPSRRFIFKNVNTYLFHDLKLTSKDGTVVTIAIDILTEDIANGGGAVVNYDDTELRELINANKLVADRFLNFHTYRTVKIDEQTTPVIADISKVMSGKITPKLEFHEIKTSLAQLTLRLPAVYRNGRPPNSTTIEDHLSHLYANKIKIRFITTKDLTISLDYNERFEGANQNPIVPAGKHIVTLRTYENKWYWKCESMNQIN